MPLAFYIAGPEVLPVLLQGFADILFVLHLNEGLTARFPIPVHRQMDPLQPVTDSALWKRDPKQIGTMKGFVGMCGGDARREGRRAFVRGCWLKSLPEKNWRRSTAVHVHGSPLARMM